MRVFKKIGSFTRSFIPTICLGMSLAAPGFTNASATNDPIDEMAGSSVVRTTAAGLASLAPPPLNGVGVQLVLGLWDTSTTDEMLDEMNGKLDAIQGSLVDIQRTLSTLRSELRQDFREALADRTMMDIEATINHIQILMRTGYYNAVYSRDEVNGELTGYSSEYLNSYYLSEYESILSESIDYFLYDNTLSDQHLMSSAADFLLMAELHLMVIQEQIRLFMSDDYICLEGEICQPKESILETFINDYYDRVDIYNDRLALLATTIKKYRMKQISYGIVKEQNYRCAPGFPHGCIQEFYYTGKWIANLNDKAKGYTQTKFNSESGAQKHVDAYKAGIEEKIDAIIEQEILGAIDDLETSKFKYKFVDGVVAQGCMALFLNDNFSGDNLVYCSDINRSKLSYTYFSWSGFKTSWKWSNSISSIKLGQDTQVKLYAWKDYKNTELVLTGKKSANLSDYDFDNNTESFKFDNLIE